LLLRDIWVNTYMGHAIAEPTITAPPALGATAAAPTAEVVLGRLAACLAHHVNNSLTGVIGYLELSLRDVGSKGNHHGHLQEGLSCAYQAAEIVKRLVAFASEKKAAARLAPVSLRQLAEQLASELQTAHGSSVSLAVAGNEDGPVLGDTALLRLTLEQIARNAVEAMPQGGTLTFRLEGRAGEGRLHVTDSGPGLSVDAAAHLFDPFWTTKPNCHLGLGLVLSRDSMAAQHGRLTVRSSAGAGTTVTLALPAAPPTEPAQALNPGEAATVLAPTTGALVAADR
jgi:signal transduction histidine kinase